jgi:hypothetical protein
MGDSTGGPLKRPSGWIPPFRASWGFSERHLEGLSGRLPPIGRAFGLFWANLFKNYSQIIN